MLATSWVSKVLLMTSRLMLGSVSGSSLEQDETIDTPPTAPAPRLGRNVSVTLTIYLSGGSLWRSTFLSRTTSTGRTASLLAYHIFESPTTNANKLRTQRYTDKSRRRDRLVARLHFEQCGRIGTPRKRREFELVSGRVMFRTLLIGGVVVLLCCLSPAQAGCGVEVKVLLSPEQTQAAIASLNAGQETVGRVYFFDTGSLDLLSQGVIVRLRQGSSVDLTVKVRPHADKGFSVPSGGSENFKCEVDIVGGEEQKSYSIQGKFAGQQIPETGNEIVGMLSAGQRDLLKQAHISTDWTLVKRIANIESKSWRVRAQPHLSPLVLELWQWPTGQVLELSARARSAAGSSAYSQLQQLATAKGLSLSRQQQFKTTLVLRALTQGVAR